MSQEYNFNVIAFYLLVGIIHKAGLKIDDLDDINKCINVIVESLVKTQDEVIRLLAVVTNKPVSEIEDLSAIDFIELLTGFIKSVKWDEFLGKLMKVIPGESEAT